MTAPAASPNRLALLALGVVFGDIGTSPLYAFRESFIGHRPLPVDELHVLGVLSLIVWALILVVTVKYVLVTMRADNRGEGGSFALLALIRRVAPSSRALPLVAGAALVATALFYGDAVITPAISILSAVEGVQLADERLGALVLPVTLGIALVLFAAQHHGSGAMGRWFGPVMLAWFVTIGLLGAVNIAARPGVLAAISPTYALDLVRNDPLRAFLTLGTVVLTITGAEALYADMGHFGRRPISRAWTVLVLPALLLCYAGQAALVLENPAAMAQAFYLLAPSWALWPLLALATAATVIASQAAITGAFSITAQAVQLGYLPRLRILHTSADERGQLYAPGVNALLCLAVIAVCVAFPSSTQLAGAFGFAVTATMVLTTALIGFVVFRVWRWNLLWALPVYAVLLVFDTLLFAAAATKILDGAWLPIGIALALIILFSTWARGRALMAAALARDALPIETFRRSTAGVPRVRGLAVYLTRDGAGVPRALLHGLKHFQALHERTLLLTVETALLPHVPPAERLRFEELAPGLGRAVVTFGFMDPPRIPPVLAGLPDAWRTEPLLTSYILGRQILVPAPRPAMARWRETLFAAMLRLAGSATEYYDLPPGRVVELGAQVSL
ncbi:potassium transporter Kup [Sediminicoccus sp. BL-A-41-H5]|uniref:potassium transporter Kup n=1 Tax=Sediminicoccus sp. BL-A-41-H5 TaxID=3421106 RepID=UPI003D66BED1